MFSAREIAQIISPDRSVVHDEESVIEHVRIDSRHITHDDNNLFVALRGKRTDGHLFLKDAWDRGARNFLVHESIDPGILPESNVFYSDDTISALQRIALAHRKQFEIETIGITGSNGKTWVKEWLYSILSGYFNVVKNPRSYNSQIGVPLSVLQIRSHHQVAIFEAGISIPGEMVALEELIRPSIGIFTYLGDAHDVGFESRQQKLEEKCRLFANTPVIIFPEDYPEVAGYIRSTFADRKLISWGFSPNAELHVRTFQRGEKASTIYEWGGNTFTLETPFLDQASWYNAMICCATLHAMGLPAHEIAQKVAELPTVNMRLELHRLPNGAVLINDSYSLDFASLQVGLDSLTEYSKGLGTALILTEIDQQYDGAYERIAQLINKYSVDRIFAIGPRLKAVEGTLNAGIESRYYDTFEAFAEERPWEELAATAFLLKGARRFQLERLVQLMKRHSHSAALTIDLNAMLLNLKYFISQLDPGTAIIAMVKAAAYGTGGSEVARFLEFHNVNTLGVAYTDEAIELRQAGIELPILIMNPEIDSIPHILRYGLEPEVYDMKYLIALNQACEVAETEVRVHVKIDTGMHRLGFEPDNLSELVTFLKSTRFVRVRSVFTHLAAAAIPEEREFTLDQVRKFEHAHRQISEGVGYPPMRHVLNSRGVVHFPEYQFEAVRLGIGLYGIGLKGLEDTLHPVHSLTGRISQIRDIEAGETVGYDRTFKALSRTRIATVNIGYADGLPRIASRHGVTLVVRGIEVPVIGNICMDMCMIDVTHLNEVSEGDEVVVFDKDHRIEILSNLCSTIPYEILTRISERIPRIFNFGW